MPALRRIGVDTGGTFTDCVLVDYDRNQVRVAKVPSVPSQPQEAILTGVARLDDGGAPVESVVHGTTIATNAVIVNDLARCGMITTAASATRWRSGPRPAASSTTCARVGRR